MFGTPLLIRTFKGKYFDDLLTTSMETLSLLGGSIPSNGEKTNHKVNKLLESWISKYLI